jgi:hypothetical protein
MYVVWEADSGVVSVSLCAVGCWDEADGDFYL